MQLGSGVRLRTGASGERRHLTRWRAAVSVQGRHNYQEEQHSARVYDISLEGATLIVEKNLHTATHATVIFFVPPKQPGKPVPVQVRGKLVYTLLGADGQFRAGVDFDEFIGDGKAVLSDVLSERIAIGSN